MITHGPHRRDCDVVVYGDYPEGFCDCGARVAPKQQDTGRKFIVDNALGGAIVSSIPDHDDWAEWVEWIDEDGDRAYSDYATGIILGAEEFWGDDVDPMEGFRPATKEEVKRWMAGSLRIRKTRLVAGAGLWVEEVK